MRASEILLWFPLVFVLFRFLPVQVEADREVSTTVRESKKPKKSLLRYLRSRDLIVVVLGVVLAISINSHFIYRLEHLKSLTDYQKWQARPKLRVASISQPKPGQSGLPPCFFVMPSSAIDQPVVSGSVGDCLLLIPEGRKLDLFEVAPMGGLSQVKTDLYVPDIIPIAFTHTIIPLDDWAKRNRISLPHVYDPYLTGNRSPYTYLDWRLPDGQSIHYQRVSPGTGFADAVYESISASPTFQGSRINWNGWGWDLTLEDGTTYLSPEAYNAERPQQGSLVGIFDKEGNEVRLSRKTNGDLTEIKSPSGRWIRLSYNKGRVFQATDNSGNVVEYGYDPEDRLATVRYSRGQTTRYVYNSNNQITKIEDSVGRTVLGARYGSHGEVVELTVDDGRTYGFHSVVQQDAKTALVDIIDPRGEITRVTLDMSADERNISYTVENLGHGSTNR